MKRTYVKLLTVAGLTGCFLFTSCRSAQETTARYEISKVEGNMITIDSEDPVFVQDEKRSSFTLNINKYIKGFEFVSYKRPSGWVEWSKQGWSVEVEDNGDIWQNDGGSALIDGTTNNYEGIASDGNISFTLDMGEERTINGVGFDYIYYSAPQNIQLSVSSDGNTWNYLGKVASADEDADYYKFIEPITARYVKCELLASWGCELYEVYVFK